MQVAKKRVPHLKFDRTYLLGISSYRMLHLSGTKVPNLQQVVIFYSQSTVNFRVVGQNGKWQNDQMA